VPRLLEGKSRMLAHAAESVGIRVDTATLRDAAGEIEWRKVSGLTVEEYEARERPLPAGFTPSRMADLQRAYERIKEERRRIDFEDVLLVTAGMIESEPRVAHQVREQHRFFVVDEYQDVSPLQHELLRLWLGDRDDLCVVGDVSQTIYSFAGARPDYLLGFQREFERAVVLRLEHNYRSSPAIVGAANALMRGRPGALSLIAGEDAPGDRSAPAIMPYDDDASEAAGVARAVAAELAGGAEPSSIAVLYRINAQSQALESAFEQRGIPTVVRGAKRFFELPEVREAVLLLRGATVTTASEDPMAATVAAVLRSIGWSHQEPAQPGAVRDRWESLDAIMKLADGADPGTSLRAFVDDLLERQAGQHEPTVAAVTLATLHSAKGLEWDSVHLVGLAEGLVPIGYARTDAAVEEERRLLYVGITRARKHLALSWAASPHPGRSAVRSPSRFLADLR
jgi:DNA helicase-2/ATP-dependent DNA helicase PcrA